MSADTGFDPRTGSSLQEVPHSSSDDVDRVVAAARDAADAVAGTAPGDRLRWLEAAADALDAAVDELVELADRETALGDERLRGEVGRMTGELRFYGSVAAEGSYLDATLDTTPMGLIARVEVPLGPVAVFGASNFPFGFGVMGTDTASALAAGCPVVVKAHPAHPATSVRLFEIAHGALVGAGAPEGVLGLVAGFAAGSLLVQHPDIRAVAFTGSQRGGMALRALAQDRAEVIPVYAEMGTVNPAVVTPSATSRIEDVATGFVGSFTLGSGQFCTKPGLLLGPRGSSDAVAAALTAAAPQPVMLTETIKHSLDAGVEELVAAGGEVVVRSGGDSGGWSAPAVLLRAPLDALVPGNRLLEEVFGAVAVVVEYDDLDDALAHVDALQGSLAASVLTSGPDDPDAPRVVDRVRRRVGRVVVDGWPTGVAVTWAQHHGGPWPSTSEPRTTSVGSAALSRFLRPVAFQGASDALLPPALRSDNPWHLPRRVDGVLVAPDPT